ncbi:MAG: hypothetical protein K940chlam5_01587, partial [Candidatus Anoxychlamydiales bacterium]|nr:hypothetical protein [Candidatus Anoxychlamydiales bacterium]
LGFKSLIEGTVLISPKVFSEARARSQARKIHNQERGYLTQAYGQSNLYDSLHELENKVKKPSIDGETLSDVFRSMQESDATTDLDNPPTINIANRINPNPKAQRTELASKFDKVRLIDWMIELSPDFRLEGKRTEFTKKQEELINNKGTIDLLQEVESIKKIVREALSDYPTLLRFIDYTGELVYDPTHVAYGIIPGPHADRNIISDLLSHELQEEYSTALSIEEYMQELERAYDTDISLQPYLSRDGFLTMIPRSYTESMAEWLESHEHNRNTDKIVLIPANPPEIHIEGLVKLIAREGISSITDKGKSLIISSWIRSDGKLYSAEDIRNALINPNIAHHYIFRDALKNILFKHGVITTDTIRALHDKTGIHITDVLYNMGLESTEIGYKPQPSLTDFTTTYARIQADIVQHFDRDRINEIMSEIDFLFNLQYKIYGIDTGNRFSRLASQTFLGWTAMLGEYKIQNFDIVDYKPLATLLGFYGNYFGDTVRKLANGKINMQKSSTLEDYIESILSKVPISERLKTLLRFDLTMIAKPYLDSIKAVENNIPTIEVKLGELRKQFTNSRRLDLMEDIVSILGVPNILTTEISQMLFGDEKHLLNDFLAPYTSNQKILERPERSTLNFMKSNIIKSNFDFDTFSAYFTTNIIRDIKTVDTSLINNRKEQILFLIDSWIKSNPYNEKYFNPSPTLYKNIFGSDIDAMTFDLLNYIWDAAVLYTDNPKIASRQITRAMRLKYPMGHGFLSGQVPSVQALMDFKERLQEALNPSSIVYSTMNDFKRNTFANTILAINAYLDILAEKRSVTNKILRPTQQSLRRMFSSDEYLRSYLFMNVISRDLGFDPAYFGPVTESDILAGLYALHHKDPTRMWSVFVRDIMLTSKIYHGAYPRLTSPGRVSVQNTDVLLQGMNALIKQGINNYKKGVAVTDLVAENDIVAVFGGYTLNDGRTVLEWWKQGSLTGVKPLLNFDRRLELFNKRIEYLAKNGQDYEKLITYLYPSLGPNWISKGKLQMDTYLFMMRHPNARRQLHYYVHLEDIDYVQDTWGVWT